MSTPQSIGATAPHGRRYPPRAGVGLRTSTQVVDASTSPTGSIVAKRRPPDTDEECDLPAGPPPPAPYFVGGTGRSGTTVIARLIGARAEVTMVPIELRFHVDPGGLADLSAGRVTVDQFARRLRRKWYERSPRNGPRGLHVIATRPQMRRGLRRLREGYDDNPWRASRRFMQDMIRPFCRESGTPTWVEMTPPNAKAADALCRMFPRGRVVHAVRDGRDVAASVAVQPWGPNAVEEALVWWARQADSHP